MAARSIPHLNEWLHSVEGEARRRKYPALFIAASDPSHPLGGGSVRYTDFPDDHDQKVLYSSLAGALHEWEKKKGINPMHDWRKSPDEPLTLPTGRVVDVSSALTKKAWKERAIHSGVGALLGGTTGAAIGSVPLAAPKPPAPPPPPNEPINETSTSPEPSGDAEALEHV